MVSQHQVDYERIAQAIEFISKNARAQPSLETMAEAAHMSPFHFQRMFQTWAGTTPKKFLQYLTLQHARDLLQQQKLSLFDTAMETGLSGTGRLHDLFVSLEGMTPAEFKAGGSSLEILFSFAESPFGKLIVASTPKGICHLAFTETEADAFHELKQAYPNARLTKQSDPQHERALAFFQRDEANPGQIRLHLRGTPFQLKVWETLLRIPSGGISTYGQIARHLGKPGASRAVGTAIGSNPVAYLIPCHRVIQQSGVLGGYRWGITRKSVMLGWEAVAEEGSS